MSDPDQTADSGETAASAASDAPVAPATGEARQDTLPAVADFPADWRALAAAGDADVEALLGRYDSPRAVARALKVLRAELSRKGPKTAPPGPDAAPEVVAAWRQARGIPARWQAYGDALSLPEAMVLGEADTPVAEDFFQAAHAANIPQPHVDAMLRWYFGHKERQDIERINADADARDASATALRGVWGTAYGRNVNVIGSTLRPIFAAFGLDLFDRLLLARMPDGRIVGDDAAMTQALLSLALHIDPAARPTPSAAQGRDQQIAGRRAQIEAIMAAPDANTRYWGDPAVQQEYRDLLEANTRQGRRRT
jgi:hypothetical protein